MERLLAVAAARDVDHDSAGVGTHASDEGWRARALDPFLEELREVASAALLDHGTEIGARGALVAEAPLERTQALPPRCIVVEDVTQRVEYHRAPS